MLRTFSREQELSERLETEYLRILFYEFSESYTGECRSYEYPRLFAVLEGGQSVATGKTPPFTVTAGDFMMLPPDTDLNVTLEEHTREIAVELSDALVKKVSENIREKENYGPLGRPLLLCTKKSPELQDVLNRICRALDGSGKGARYILDVYAQELVFMLFRVPGARRLLEFEPDGPVGRAIQYMERAFAGPMSIREVSDIVSMSEAGFCRAFKRAVGVSPKEYLTNLRMEKARELLTAESVTDAALDLGYGNISLFISTFKGRYGVTPKQYRLQCAVGRP